MVAILYQPNNGIPGDISRPHQPYTAQPYAFDNAHPFSAYGLPGKLSGGKLVPITAQNDVVEALLIRPYPRQATVTSDGLGTATPPTDGPADGMRKGYANVFSQNGTPAQGGAVYIRFQNPGSGKIVGGLEAANSGDVYQWTGVRWEGPADASGNVEISFI